MRVLVALTMLVFVVLVVFADAVHISPGPLAPAHEKEPELQRNDGCVVCHGEGDQTMADACLACHEDLGRDLELGRGVHGELLDPELAADCARCHMDHHGAEIELAGARSFALAGIEDLHAFGHEGLGWDLSGRHDELRCGECHANAHVQTLPRGETRFRGLEQACTHCHEDTHDGEFGASCAECHGEQEAFALVAAFAHDPRYPLHGAHARVTCRECHAADGRVSVAALIDGAGSLDVTEARDSCLDCHASPHSAGFERRVSLALGVRERGSCVRCHRAAHETFRSDQTLMTPALHAVSGFPLDAPHDQAGCAECHARDEALAFEAGYPGRHPDACSACHADPHGAQFDAEPWNGGCLACHERHAFEPPAFGLEEHAGTAFPLRGAHVTAECRACHEVPASGEPRVFRGTPESCARCHDDPHGGQFTGSALAAQDCRACHGEDAFAPSEFGLEHHGRTAFVLDGGHEAVGCRDCHPAAAGEPVVFRDAPQSCADCHEDPHDGAFDGAEAPPVEEGRDGCARCHTTSSFHDVDSGRFEHRVWTSFPLEGAHATVGCADCHRPSAEELRQGRSFGRAPGMRCDDCHVDVHRGQFASRDGRFEDDRTDCARCHSVRPGFEADRFDHQVGTRFALDERHVDLACATCHQRYEFAGGRSVVRYRPLGVRCIDCHDTEEGPLPGRGKR